MKRTQLIEWGIVTIGLIFGYKFFEAVFSAIVRVLSVSFLGGIADLGNTIVPLLVFIGIYAAGFIVLIRNSNPIARYLNGVAVDDTVPIKIGKRSLLHVILIAICIATILSNIAEILLYLFETFKKEVGRKSFIESDKTTVSKYSFTIAAIQTIAAMVILYFSKTISDWFIRKNEVDELSFDSTPE